MGHCEARIAHHCCVSVSEYCWGPWNTPQRQKKAAKTTNHNKHQPYLGQLPPFFIPGECCQILENGPLCGKESPPLLWQCLRTLLGSMEHTTRAARGSHNHPSQQTSAIPRPTAPFFHSWRVLSNIGKWAIVRQGEPTIVVAVSQNIAGGHGTHHKGRRRQPKPPITTNISHT